jgi:hypothetical protein
MYELKCWRCKRQYELPADQTTFECCFCKALLQIDWRPPRKSTSALRFTDGLKRLDLKSLLQQTVETYSSDHALFTHFGDPRHRSLQTDRDDPKVMVREVNTSLVLNPAIGRIAGSDYNLSPKASI